MELAYTGSQVLIVLGMIALCLIVGIIITKLYLHRAKTSAECPESWATKYAMIDVLRYRFRPLALAGLLSLTAMITLMSWTTYKESKVYVPIDFAVEEMEVVPPIINPPKPNPLPPPIVPVEVEVTDEEILEEPNLEPVDIDADTFFDEPLPEMPVVDEGPKTTPPPLPEVKDDIEEIVDFSEVMPLFGGCEDKTCSDKKLLQYLSKSVKYPTVARDNGIAGRVYVQFVVEKDGSVKGTKIVRSVGAGCDKEVLRVIEKMNTLSQRWTPGKHHGHTVRVKYTLPVTFKLD